MIRNEHEKEIDSRTLAVDNINFSKGELHPAQKLSERIADEEAKQKQLMQILSKDVVYVQPEHLNISAYGGMAELNAKAGLQNKYYSRLIESHEMIEKKYNEIQSAIEYATDLEIDALMELEKTPALFYLRVDNDGRGIPLRELAKYIANLPEGYHLVRTLPALLNRNNIAILASDKTDEEVLEAAKAVVKARHQKRIDTLKQHLQELIHNHQQLAKSYKRELAEIQRFDDLLSIPKTYTKAI